MKRERKINRTTLKVMLFTFTALMLAPAIPLPLTAYFAAENAGAAQAA